jgi:hypothetical protein
LPRLATGEDVAAFALTEPSSGSDAAVNIFISKYIKKIINFIKNLSPLKQELYHLLMVKNGY